MRWGPHDLAPGTSLDLALGTLRCRVHRGRLEWEVEYRYDQDRFVRESGDETSRVRFTAGSGVSGVVVVPSLADRSVVASPVDPIRIPPGAAATLYVSTPVWVRIETAAGGDVLADLPAQILSDTWFGPDTRVGELAYANETQARMDVDRLPLRPDRVTTPVTLTNAGGEVLAVEHVNLPTPELSVYEASGRLWTQGVRITTHGAGDSGELRLSDGPPSHLSGAELRQGPRRQASRESVTRALSMLFR